MNDAPVTGSEAAGLSRDEMMAALFAHMVMQQANLAMMLLGRMPHPQTGQTSQDLEAAKLFIDQLEMLEVKTKGNLSREEEQLLKQNLMAVRLAFVETAKGAAPGAKPAAESAEPAPAAASAAEEESKKKFSKKY